MFITLYFIVTRLPESLRSVRDHFLSLDPTVLTIDLLEQHLLAAETSVVTVVLRTSGLLLLVRSAAAARARVAGMEAVAAGVVVEAVEVVAAVGVVAGVGALVAAVEAAVGVAVVAAVGVVAVRLELSVEVQEEARGSGSSSRARPRRPSSFTCRKPHTQHCCFSCLDDAWRTEFGDEVERAHWAELLRSGVAIFDLDYDAILSAMYALYVSAEGDCYRCVPPDQGIEAAALGASESSLPGTAPAEALHTFTLDSGASCSFFRDSTTLTPLPAPVPVRLADFSGGPVLVRSSTILPCSAVPSGSPSGLHLSSFSTNLVSTAALQDAIVTTTTPGGQIAPPCSCRHLSHQTLLWHHRLGHPSLPRVRHMHSCLLVSCLPRSLPPLLPSPALPCLLCVEGRQRAAPHSSSFPLMSAPLQTLHMDVWGPARVSGQGRECYFLLVVDDYTHYTTVFPLRSKSEVPDVLMPWIHAVCLQLGESFGQDSPVLRLHPDRGGEFSSNLLRDFCRGEVITQSFMLPASSQQNGIAERRIGLVMEVACTSMIHATAPHFLWLFAVRYTAHQLNLRPCVSLPVTSPPLRWMGKVGDASVFRVWGSRAFVRDSSADKLSARTIPCVFLGLPPDVPGWQFYHPTSRRFLFSQDVTFDDSVPFCRLFPYRSAPPPPPLLFLAAGPPLVDSLPPQDLAPSGVSQVDPLLGVVLVEVAGDLGAARGAVSWGVGPGGAEPWGAESEGAGFGGAEPGGAELEGVKLAGVATGGAEPEGVERGGAESEGSESGGAEPRGAASSGGPAGASPRLSPRPEPLSPQQLCEWLVWRARLRSGAAGARATRDTGDIGAGGAEVTTGAGGAGGLVVLGALELETLRSLALVGLEALELEALAVVALELEALALVALEPKELELVELELEALVGAGEAGGVHPGAGGARAGCAGGTALTPSLLFPPPDQLQPPLQLASPLPASSPYSKQTSGLTKRREPTSRLANLVHTSRRVPHPRPPPVPYTHAMALRPSSVPQRVPLPVPPESALPDPESDRARAASPTVSRLLATVVTDPSFDSTAASALVAELLDYAAACRLDYAIALVAESVSASPPSIGGECALGTDVLEDRQEDVECLAAAVPHFASMLLAPEETRMHQTSRPHALTQKRLRRDNELHSLDFSTAFLQGSVHEEIWLRRPPGFSGSLPAGTQWSLRRPVHGLRQAPREWHDTLRTTPAALGFTPSTTEPSLFLQRNTSVPPFYVLVTSGMGLLLGGRGPIVLTGQVDASWAYDSATQRSSQGYTFSLGFGSVSWRSTRSSLVLSSSCEAEIYAGAMAAQELRRLTYLLTYLGEQPRSPPVLYIDNETMIALTGVGGTGAGGAGVGDPRTGGARAAGVGVGGTGAGGAGAAGAGAIDPGARGAVRP
ncbi:unnamed protein product [Closterium sp. NIES-54]